jgi:Zinc knuckle
MQLRTWNQRPNQQNPQQPPRQQTYNSTNAPHPAYNNVQVPMDLSRTRAPNNRRFPRANQASTDGAAARLSETIGPCFHCGKMGHLIRNCHSRQRESAYPHNTFQPRAARATSIAPEDSISYMDTNEDAMRSVPPPTIAPSKCKSTHYPRPRMTH